MRVAILSCEYCNLHCFSIAEQSTTQQSRAEQSTAEYSTAQHRHHSTAKRSTAQQSTSEHSRTQQSCAKQDSTAEQSKAQHRRAQQSTTQQSTAQHSTYGQVWARVCIRATTFYALPVPLPRQVFWECFMGVWKWGRKRCWKSVSKGSPNGPQKLSKIDIIVFWRGPKRGPQKRALSRIRKSEILLLFTTL